MYKFIHKREGVYAQGETYPEAEIVYTIPTEDLTWPVLLAEFLVFLRAGGFVIDECQVEDILREAERDRTD